MSGENIPRAAHEQDGDDLAMTEPLAALLLTRAYLGFQRLRRDQLASRDADQIERELLLVFDFLKNSWVEQLHPTPTVRPLSTLFGDLRQPLEEGQP